MAAEDNKNVCEFLRSLDDTMNETIEAMVYWYGIYQYASTKYAYKRCISGQITTLLQSGLVWLTQLKNNIEGIPGIGNQKLNSFINMVCNDKDEVKVSGVAHRYISNLYTAWIEKAKDDDIDANIRGFNPQKEMETLDLVVKNCFIQFKLNFEDVDRHAKDIPNELEVLVNDPDEFVKFLWDKFPLADHQKMMYREIYGIYL